MVFLTRPCQRPVKVSGIRYLVDEGPLIGLFGADEKWHERSAETLQAINAPMATKEAVLAEVAHRLRRLRPAVVILPRLVAERRLIVYPALADHAERIEALLGKCDPACGSALRSPTTGPDLRL